MNIPGRLKKLRQAMAEKEIDAILVSQPENRRYLSGFDGSAGFLLITPRDAILATDFRYTEQAGNQAPDYEIFRTVGDMADWLPALASRLGEIRLGFEAGHITFAQNRQLSAIIAKAGSRLSLVPVNGLVEPLRAIKEPEEIELITGAVDVADSALAHVERVMRAGMTEKEVAWAIEKFMREKGSQPVPFEIIVASGPNSALPHARPSARVIQDGEPVVIDIGARLDGYSSDLTRTFYLGAPDVTFKKVYDTVLGAQLAAIALLKEGMSGEEADSLARAVIEEAGYGEAFGHGLGHGVGLAPHELPRLGPKSQDRLAGGMIFTIEPGIYLPGWGGVRIEDMVAMGDGEIRTISKARKT
ncbi:MAG: aminopeptidase P family protein [Chloroflexi bacterium]|nr:aminopeptidase P family protein [Chloroflexota bacterium]